MRLPGVRVKVRERVVEASCYQVKVRRGDRFWLVHVPEIDQWTQARHPGEVETMARDLIAIMTEIDPHSFELDIEVAVPP